jgi:hypothetical protein
MKTSRLLLLGLLALAAVVAYLVRQRSAETGEDYATAARGLMTDASRARNEAYAQVQRAVQDGRLAAFRREETLEQDLAAAGDRVTD